MKTELEWQQKWGTSFLLAAILLTVLSLPLPAFSSTVTLTGSWATGTTHAKESGTNRALIFIAHATLSNDANLVSVTYGSQQMTKVIERNYTNATTRSYTAAFILNEAGVAAATSSTFTPTWRTTPSSPKYSSAFFSNALQAALVGDSSSGGATTTTITTSALATGGGDMVILGATAGSQSSYTLNNDFTEGTDQSQFLTLTGVTGHKSATGAAETPSATISSASTYQSIIGFVLRANYDQIPPNNAINVDLKTNLGWIIDPCATSYDVYFGTNSSVRNNPKTTVDTNSFDPPSDLEIGTKYYWAVDSNRNGTIITGSTWNFTTLILSDRVTGNMMLLNDNGGWCWYQDEKIVYDPVGRNVLISTAACPYGFGGVGGARLDDVDTTTLNIDTGKRTRTLAKDNFGGDDHNMGAFWIRPDGRYLLVFCSHYNTPELTRLRLSTYPNDGSEWGTEWSYDWQAIDGLTDSQDLSYTNVQYLSSEGTGMGRLYNIVRVNTRTPCISYSDDWGATWKYMGRLNSPAGGATYSNFYHKFQGNGVDRIYFVGNENHPRNNNNGCYAGYIQKGKSYNSYGVEIDSNLFDIHAFVRVRIDSSKHYKSFMEHVMKEDEIMECFSVTGEGSHILKVMTHNTASLEQFLSRIQSWPGVLGTNTSFVLTQLKKNKKISAEIVRNNLQDRQVLITFDEKKSRK